MTFNLQRTILGNGKHYMIVQKVFKGIVSNRLKRNFYGEIPRNFLYVPVSATEDVGQSYILLAGMYIGQKHVRFFIILAKLG